MTGYTKLVEALRILQDKNSLSYYKRQVCKDAADAIEALQAKIERLTKENRELAADRPEMEEVNGKWEWKNPYEVTCKTEVQDESVF